MSYSTDKADNDKLDLYWQKLCVEHDVDDYIKTLFNELAEENK